MKVLVTGGAGYIGVELVRALLESGDDVTVLDRLYFGGQPLEEFAGRIRLIQADVRDFDGAWLSDIEGVCHLAGLSNDPTAEYNPSANWEMNAVATQRLAAACAERGVPRLVFGSSASIYDGIGPGMYDETTEVRPRGAYSLSKKFAEDALLELASEEFSPVILRQGTVYGYSPRMRFDLVVNTFLKDALLYRKLFLHGGGWQWRPLVDVRDVARAHMETLRAPRDAVHAQIFNVMQENYQVRQLAMLVSGSLALTGRHVELVDAPLPALVRDYRMSNVKMTQVLGFTPQITVLESIEGLLRRLPLDGYAELAHPRYYNIAWMTLLESVQESQRAFASIY
ncbi:MAG: SDR family oxidoreductase [Candidatus Eremiobacteraeota bacterium]|nr:SDR family oxidoreductase [Candidatus Eremiobacteraeota bacterium]